MKFASLSSKIARTCTFLLIGALTATLAPSALFAASVTSYSDTLSREKAAVAANHDIRFVTPTGVASTNTVVLTFSGFSSISGASVDFNDIDLQEGNSSNCTTASFTDKTLVASGPSSSQFSAATAATTVTFTSGGASATITAGVCVRILIGTNATSGSTGTHQIVNGSAGTGTLALSGSFGDSGTLAIPIIADDQVVVTATVNPTITFSLTSGGSGSGGSATNAVDFGVLTSGAVRYATAGASSGGTTSLVTPALDLNVGTNATSGYTITFNAPTTLTDGSHPITAATLTGTNTGTAGATQFSMSAIGTVGSPVVATAFRYNSTAGSSNWNFVAAATTMLASGSAATSGDTTSVRFLSNIPASQAPGSYSVTVTYIATGNF